MRSRHLRFKVIGGTVCLVVAFIAVGWLPAYQEILSLRDQISETSEELLGAEGKAQDITDLNKSVEQMRNELNRNQKTIPVKTEMAEFMRSMGRRIKELQLYDHTINTRPEQRESKYIVQPLEIQFAGDGLSAMEFLNHVEHLPRLVQVTRLRLERSERGGAKVTTQIDMNTYFYENRRGEQ